MQKRTLGTNGPQVSTLGFGRMGISFGLGPALSREQRRVRPRASKFAARGIPSICSRWSAGDDGHLMPGCRLLTPPL